MENKNKYKILRTEKKSKNNTDLDLKVVLLTIDKNMISNGEQK